ncbi:MAG: sulfatase [Planctomycetaceae bacterium]|nr:sulfatase [Planctomycetaceae bacterium]
MQSHSGLGGRFLGSCLVASALLILSGNRIAAAADRPNLVLINVDDLGYADIGCFGSTNHRTPNVDRLAAEGMRLTSFYSTSGVCSPSRSSLMTGCYPRRVNLHQDHAGAWVLFPRGRKGLHPDEVTIAEVLKGVGYATGIVGKWHLGDQPEFLPTRQGFDSYFGIPYSNDMGQTDRPNKQYPPLPLLRNELVIESEPDQRYITQRYTEEALQFICNHAQQPFFLYLPHTMPHWPQYSSENFAGKSANGKWGDAVEEVDWSTGRIMETIEELGLTGKTLILFTSDNGGPLQHGASNVPLKGGKGSTLEGGQRVCCVVRWPGHVPAGSTCDEVVSTLDVLPTFAALAGTSPPDNCIIDGHDVRPLLFGDEGARSPRQAFYYYHRGDLECIRSGRWKLRVSTQGSRKKPERKAVAELYDLDADIGETSDVAKSHPEIVAKLQGLAEEARRDLGDGDRAGENQRPAGMVTQARALTD